jgi:hypothetical protein
MASSLLDIYKGIRDTPERFHTEAEYRKIIDDLFYGLTLLDKSYFLQARERNEDLTSVMNLLAEKKRGVMDAYLAGNYKGVIDQALDLKNSFGPNALTGEIGFALALSLAREGRTEEATQVGEEIVRTLEGRPDLVDLRAHMAEWFLQLGQRDKALRMYEKLTDVLDERQAAVEGLGKKVKGAPETQPGAVETSVPQPEQTSETKELEAPPAPFLQTVEKLVREGRFGEARDLLVARKSQAPSDSEAGAIDRALKELDSAEEKFLDEKMASLSHREESLSDARKLLDEEKYEEAISQLEVLEKDHVAGDETEALKQRAIDEWINRERNRAAKLFLAAKQTEDPYRKEKYLNECFAILKNVALRYPSSPLMEKVRSHMETVSEELSKLKKAEQ